MMRFPVPAPADVPLYLAPMAGVSESPFRRLCRQHGADVVVTEFLSAEGIRRENEATLHKLAFGPDERPIGVQIFGADPAAMGEAARFVSDVFQPEFIDINFGCPVKKVVRRNGGSGCLRDLDLVQQVIRAVVAGDAPARDVQDPQRLERGDARSGADRAALPGRRREGAHAASAHAHADVLRHARWEEIAAVVEALDIPVLGNGDIKVAEDAVRMHEQTRCAGIMIARGSYGQPWIFDQVKDLLAGRPKRPAPSIEERFAVALHHARMVMEYETDPRGAAIEFRKHLGWYAKGLHGGAELRKRLYAVTSFAEVEGIFGDYLANQERYAAARPVATATTTTVARGRRRVRRERVRDLLGQVADGSRAGRSRRSHSLAQEPIGSLGFATIDHHRALRQGFPEVVYGAGKTTEQVVAIAQRIADRGDGVLVTRVAPDAVRRAAGRAPGRGAQRARAHGAVLRAPRPPATARGTVLIVTAGTSDLPVAEEAAVTADAMGCRRRRLTDVGVAGIHRLLAQRERAGAAPP